MTAASRLLMTSPPSLNDPRTAYVATSSLGEIRPSTTPSTVTRALPSVAPASSSPSSMTNRLPEQLPARGLSTAVAFQETKEHDRAPLPSSSSLAAAIPLRVIAEGSRDPLVQPIIIRASNSSPTDRTNVSSTIDLSLVPATSLFRLMNSSEHLGAPSKLPDASRALDRVDDSAMTDDAPTAGEESTSAPQHAVPSALPQAQHGARRGDQAHKSGERGPASGWTRQRSWTCPYSVDF